MNPRLKAMKYMKQMLSDIERRNDSANKDVGEGYDLLKPVEDVLSSKLKKISSLTDDDIYFNDCLIYVGVRGIELSNAEAIFYQLEAGESLDEILRYNKVSAYNYICGYTAHCKYMSDLYIQHVQSNSSVSKLGQYRTEKNYSIKYLNSVKSLISSKRMTRDQIIDGISDDDW